VRSWWLLPVVAAVVAGVLLGSALYLVRPLHLTASGASPSSPAGGPTPAPKTPSPTRSSAPPSATESPRVPSGPAFTKRALLQRSEFLQYKWGKADQLSLTTGVNKKAILRCLRPQRVTIESVAAYAATYHGRTTLAGEQVIRYYSVAEAEGVFDQLAGQVDQCADRDSTRRATVGKRHDPDLGGISQTRWWNLSGAKKGDPMRGVLVIMRVDDRLMALCLTSDSTDPEETTDIIPLMRQGGLRLV
jgi:hypothetical protein